MSIHKAHLVAVTLGNPSDEIVDMADGGANGSHCFPGAEPRLHLQLPSPLLHLEIEVQVLEVPGQNSSRPCNPNLLRLDLDLHPSRKIHGLRRHDGLHDASTSFLSIELSDTTAREALLRSQGKWKKRTRQETAAAFQALRVCVSLSSRYRIRVRRLAISGLAKPLYNRTQCMRFHAVFLLLFRRFLTLSVVQRV